MIRLVLLLLALATPSRAEVARVLSGEHGDFTRLVVELPPGADWTVGRTAEGYAFAATGGTQPSYDLSTVWQRIPRSRLTSIAVDPTTGALTLALGCDCHVFPFQYGDGIIVLDVREGPPPAGSVFEAAFMPPAPTEPSVSEAGGYDWLADTAPKTARPSPRLPLPLDTGGISLEPLRDQLLEQIARGAADGLVDMEMPGKLEQVPNNDVTELPWSNIRVGEQPGLIVTTPGNLFSERDDSADCAPDALLDLAAWGEGRLPRDLLAEARDGLYGEFDAPDKDAILRSARELLYLGFGVEAGQYLDLLGPDVTSEPASLLRSMARLIDGEADPLTPFAKMLDCDGPAALWAALAHDRLPAGPGVNRGAIIQAYQALPPHLRGYLGPDLAGKFLARDDAEAARIIRDAMERTPEADPASVALLDAQAGLHAGDAEAAQAHAETAVSLDGDRVDNLIALVEAHLRDVSPIDAEISEALRALRGETEDASLGMKVDRAIVLSLALSGQIGAAFEEKPAPDVLPDLWAVVLARATDDDFLLHAVLPESTPPPDVAPDVARAVADRLLGLGFPDAALAWLGPVDPTAASDLRLIAARAELDRGDARAAVALLDGLEDEGAEGLRAKALLQLGELRAAKDALAKSGDFDAAVRTDLWAGAWSELDPAAPETWRSTADYAQAEGAAGGTGLLGRGSQTIEASIAARGAIDALLESVPSPASN